MESSFFQWAKKYGYKSNQYLVSSVFSDKSNLYSVSSVFSDKSNQYSVLSVFSDHRRKLSRASSRSIGMMGTVRSSSDLYSSS